MAKTILLVLCSPHRLLPSNIGLCHLIRLFQPSNGSLCCLIDLARSILAPPLIRMPQPSCCCHHNVICRIIPTSLFHHDFSRRPRKWGHERQANPGRNDVVEEKENHKAENKSQMIGMKSLGFCPVEAPELP